MQESLDSIPFGTNTDEDIAQALDVHRDFPRRTFQTSPYTNGWLPTEDMGWLFTTLTIFHIYTIQQIRRLALLSRRHK